jgi:hypothetical protein
MAALAMSGCVPEEPQLAAEEPATPEPLPSDPQPALVVSGDPVQGFVTHERGSETNLRVVLDAEPAGELTISLTSSDPTEGTVTPESLTFGPGDWDIPQTVTVTGVDDDEMDGNQAFAVALEPLVTGLAAPGVSGLVVEVTNADDEAPGVTINALQTSFSEAGGTGVFSLLLNSAPDGDVVVEVGCTDPSEALLSGEDGEPGERFSVTFAADDWSIPRRVLLHGQDDDEIDGDQVLDLSIRVDGDATEDSTGYAALAPQSLEVIVEDDDTEWITVEILRRCAVQGG